MSCGYQHAQLGRKGLAAHSLGIYNGLLGKGAMGSGVGEHRKLGREKALGSEGYSAGQGRAGVELLTTVLVRGL